MSRARAAGGHQVSAYSTIGKILRQRQRRGRDRGARDSNVKYQTHHRLFRKMREASAPVYLGIEEGLLAVARHRAQSGFEPCAGSREFGPANLRRSNLGGVRGSCD